MKLVVLTVGEIPCIYLSNFPTDQLVENLNRQWRLGMIYELKTNFVQTPNPFGAHIQDPIVVRSNELRNTYLQNYLIEWHGMSKEQVVAETKRAVQKIYDQQNKFLDSMKREEEDPRTEIIQESSNTTGT